MTVGRPFGLRGVGLHSGARSFVTIEPAHAGGIVFVRADLPGGPAIPATLESVRETDRRTVLGSGAATVSTVEHLLAALQAHGITDATIVVDGPELPQLDGSALPYARGLVDAGTVLCAGRVRRYVVGAPLDVAHNGARYHVEPATVFEIDVSIEWGHPKIGRQSVRCDVTPDTFDAELAAARTFGFTSELSLLQNRGLIRGVAADNVVALSEDRVLHGNPLRWPDEFARHKALDLVGDLALLGGTLAATITAHRPSHAGNICLGRAIRECTRGARLRHEVVADGSS